MAASLTLPFKILYTVLCINLFTWNSEVQQGQHKQSVCCIHCSEAGPGGGQGSTLCAAFHIPYGS